MFISYIIYSHFSCDLEAKKPMSEMLGIGSILDLSVFQIVKHLLTHHETPWCWESCLKKKFCYCSIYSDVL